MGQTLNIYLDLKLLQNMTERVVEAFGLTREHLEGLARITINGLPLDKMLDAARPVLGRLAAGGLTKLLQLSFAEAVKEGGEAGLQFIPILGQAAAMGVNFATAYLYGTRLVSDCEDCAMKILSLVSHHSLRE